MRRHQKYQILVARADLVLQSSIGRERDWTSAVLVIVGRKFHKKIIPIALSKFTYYIISTLVLSHYYAKAVHYFQRSSCAIVWLLSNSQGRLVISSCHLFRVTLPCRCFRASVELAYSLEPLKAIVGNLKIYLTLNIHQCLGKTYQKARVNTYDEEKGNDRCGQTQFDVGVIKT